MPWSPKRSCHNSLKVVTTGFCTKWHHTLFGFYMISATSFSNTSPFTLCFLFSYLLSPLIGQVHWVAPLSQMAICGVTSSAYCHKSCASDWTTPSYSCVFQQLHCLLIQCSLRRKNNCEKNTNRKKSTWFSATIYFCFSNSLYDLEKFWAPNLLRYLFLQVE